MSIPKIFGIYFNNLRFDQIRSLYKKYVGNGARNKVDQINELVEHFDELPDEKSINDFLYSGRVSLSWYKLDEIGENSLESLKQHLSGEYPGIFEEPREVRLTEDFEIIHATEKEGKIILCLGEYDDYNHMFIDNYELKKQSTESFCYAVLRNSTPCLEIRANAAARTRAALAIQKNTNLVLPRLTRLEPIQFDDFIQFKDLLDAKIRKYKGRVVDESSIHEMFEYTAKQGYDYGDNLEEFESMRLDKEDESLTMSFDYEDDCYTLRIGMINRSIYFPSFVPEGAIDYVYDIYHETLLGN